MSFVNYLKGSETLEERLEQVFRELDIEGAELAAILGVLSPLLVKGGPYKLTWEHSVRVGLLTKAVAEFVHLNPKAGLYPGLLHDTGKILTPADVLGKTDVWTPEDYRVIARHVMDGFRILADRFPFSAEVMLHHHRFQPNPYPKRLRHVKVPFSAGTKTKILYLGRILAICDSYDAAHRKNRFQGQLRVPTGEEIKAMMLSWHVDQKELVEALYEAEIFTTYIEPQLEAVTA
jgi:response regulator RpfG family c-di-GMP phosphodiesterase